MMANLLLLEVVAGLKPFLIQKHACGDIIHQLWSKKDTQEGKN